MKEKVFNSFEDLGAWLSSKDLKKLLPVLPNLKPVRVNNLEELRGYDQDYLFYDGHKIYAHDVLAIQSYAARYFKKDEIWGNGSRNSRLLMISSDMTLKEVLSYIGYEIDIHSKKYIDHAQKMNTSNLKLWRNHALAEFVALYNFSRKKK